MPIDANVNLNPLFVCSRNRVVIVQCLTIGRPTWFSIDSLYYYTTPTRLSRIVSVLISLFGKRIYRSHLHWPQLLLPYPIPYARCFVRWTHRAES